MKTLKSIYINQFDLNYQLLIVLLIDVHVHAFQMERVENDLNKSKQAREKQCREFSKQLDEERNQHERKVK